MKNPLTAINAIHKNVFMITTDLNMAMAALEKEEPIAIPTETVYGLAANAYSEKAIKKVFHLKNRPLNNPLIVHIKSISFLPEVAQDIPPAAFQLAEKFWPGPLTLLVRKNQRITDFITAGKDTVAVRVPNHPITLELLHQLNFPLVAPSANPFSFISPTKADHVFNYFKDELPIILEGGECEKGIESTIIGFENNQAILYRLGAISIEEIENEIGEVKILNQNNQDPKAPGMLSKHYSPKTELLLSTKIEETIKNLPDKKIGLLLFKNEIASTFPVKQEILSKKGNLPEAAKNLYAAMHRLDNQNLDIIIAEIFPNEGLGKSINDRLQRAANKNN